MHKKHCDFYLGIYCFINYLYFVALFRSILTSRKHAFFVVELMKKMTKSIRDRRNK